VIAKLLWWLYRKQYFGKAIALWPYGIIQTEALTTVLIEVGNVIVMLMDKTML